MARKVCVVSGGRADYGLLLPLMKVLKAADDFSLQIVATGMHLAPEYGATLGAFAADGLAVDDTVETLLASDTPVGIAKAIGLGVIGFSELFARRTPDLVMVLGDRFEIFAAAQAAYVARVPIAHWCGGDLTEGAFDEGFRHAISKLAHLHFATNEPAAGRLRAMGEPADRVFVVGSPGLDALRMLDLPDRSALERELGFALGARNLLVTFHPVTIELGRSLGELDELLAALDALEDEVRIVVTLPNADTEGRTLRARIEAWAAGKMHVLTAAALGQRRYLGLMRLADAVVGNSSSGLYEAPSLGTPVVNIGTRQAGRIKATSVIDCPPERSAIRAAIERAFAMDASGTRNPYGDGRATERMLAILRGIGDFKALIHKRFAEPDRAP